MTPREIGEALGKLLRPEFVKLGKRRSRGVIVLLADLALVAGESPEDRVAFYTACWFAMSEDVEAPPC